MFYVFVFQEHKKIIVMVDFHFINMCILIYLPFWALENFAFGHWFMLTGMLLKCIFMFDWHKVMS